jgi:hypothetical protein
VNTAENKVGKPAQSQTDDAAWSTHARWHKPSCMHRIRVQGLCWYCVQGVWETKNIICMTTAAPSAPIKHQTSLSLASLAAGLPPTRHLVPLFRLDCVCCCMCSCNKWLGLCACLSSGVIWTVQTAILLAQLGSRAACGGVSSPSCGTV